MDNSNNTTLSKLYPWVVWLLGASFFFYEFFIQVSPNVMVPELMEYFHVYASHLGTLTLFYFIAYASMQIPAGMLLDKFGPRRLITAAVMFCAIGSISFATTHSFAVAEFARFLTGLGSAFALLGTLVLTANWFPSTRFAFLSGLLVTVGMTGAIFGEAPLAYAIEHFHWQTVIYSLGIIGVLLGLVIWIVVRDHPKGVESQHGHITLNRLMQGIKRILKFKYSWLTACYGTLMYAPTVILGALWGVSFLVERFSMNRTHAATLISLLFVGWAIGCPIFGAFSDAIRRRKPPLYIASIGAFICIFLILYMPGLSNFFVAGLILMFGFFSSGFIPAFSISRELHPFEYSGSALGFMNMLNALGSAFIPYLVGVIMDLAWDGTVQADGTRLYTNHDYSAGMSALPILIGISIIIIPFLKETHCEPPKE